MKALLCSSCREWVPDFRAYHYDGRIWCDECLPTGGWTLVLHGAHQ